MSLLRIISKISLAVALTGGCVGLISLWAMFHKGNSSIWIGEVFIPMLGPHGIYTTRLLGTAWYLGGASFLVGGLLWVLAAIIERQATR
ncbi:hypothetical protein OMW55_00405 [Sphingomonas sp. BN140010]|uniref:Integron gene cassette protein n=1 Tax=Sphingomonas arvum TaxID=2992113 RepID=A0ABT3JBS6_9SPHN|nr:hypothetical protein [Sphingomonas sp. BN140010]MCW3796271.1 hypothetical protein [Sphingomonas sp. BN140010]